jgi:hypothetical protein
MKRVLVVIGLLLLPSYVSAADKLAYNRDVRPILADNCFACHGPDSASRKGDLRLDQRPAALEHKAFVPGQPDKSAIIERITTKDPEQLMPPPSSHKKLTAAQIDTLRRWIAEGAEYQPHWSLIAPKKPTPPVVKNEAWIKNPLDRFVLAKLESLGLAPAPEADRRTIARRLSLDLTGLPPAPGDVETFVHDTSASAYERYVDKLLDMPQWGEHRGRYWLDAARYADTHGIHFDNYREIWAYRDWVISAFNRNLPFDQFTIEQLAGDLLPNRTLDQQIASGFNRCNITTNEGGAIAEEYAVLYTRDRTETVGQVWLGTSVGCTVCHDHKFDPLSQREFYELAAFFNNTTQTPMDGNIKDTPPVLIVPAKEDRPRWESLNGELAKIRTEQGERAKAARAEFDKWSPSASIGDLIGRLPLDGLELFAPLADNGPEAQYVVNGSPRSAKFVGAAKWTDGHTGPAALQVHAKSQLELSGASPFETKRPFSASIWVKMPATARNGTIVSQMDEKQRGWELRLENGRVSVLLADPFPSAMLRAIPRNNVPLNQWVHLAMSYDGSGKATGLRLYVNGVVQDLSAQADNLPATTKVDAPVCVGQRKGGKALLEDGLFQDVRLYTRVLSQLDVSQLHATPRAVSIVAKPATARTPAESNELFGWWLAALDEPHRALAAKIASLDGELITLKLRGTVAHVMQERNDEAMAFVLFRGEYDKRRDPVKPDTPDMLPPMPKELPRNRLGFAQWLLRPEQPLTARVTVNRFWQELFGQGLVRSTGDFGVAGELPSHPELLDWLAIEFREQAWDIKKFFKLLVTSATYRQSALVDKLKLEKDPANRFLSRGPRFRMDAEMVRDYALASSGLLVRKLGGPSVRPYQPEGVWEAVAMIGSNTRDYKVDSGENLYRRSMYTIWKRSAPPASMDIFNAPSRETCAVRRERTNTPLQALVTLNDPQFVEAARNLAQSAIKAAPHDDLRIDHIARRLLARSLRENEMTVVRGSLVELQKFYQSHATEAKQLIAFGESKADASIDVAQLAAWTMLTNELMNLDEVLNK